MSQLVKATTKAYTQLTPKQRSSVNALVAQVATRAANAAVNAVVSSNKRKQNSRRRSATTRTRNGIRPNVTVQTESVRAIAPVSYANNWQGASRPLRVSQSEVVGKITANSTWFPSWNDNYSVMTFPLNPASPTTFPWLSRIAILFDKYRFHSLRFRYVNSTSTATKGNLMFALDYDTLDAAPGNLIEGSQLAKYQLTPLYIPSSFSVPTSNGWLYTLEEEQPKNSDLKTYNMGNVFIALDGVPQDAEEYGYLIVDYDVELLDKNAIPVKKGWFSYVYDSVTPSSKSLRSDADPADTFELGVENTDTVVTIKAVSDIKAGTKMRVMVAATCGATEAAVNTVTVSGATVLGGANPAATGLGYVSYYKNVDYVADADKTSGDTLFTITSSIKLDTDTGSINVMAYTYQ